MRFRTALLGFRASGKCPPCWIYAYLGTFAQFGLGVLLRRAVRPKTLDLIVWGGGLTLTIAATTGLTRLTVRLLAEAERTAALPSCSPPPLRHGPNRPPSRTASGVLTR